MRLFGVPLERSDVWPGSWTGEAAGLRVYLRESSGVEMQLAIGNSIDAIRLYASAATRDECIRALRRDLEAREAETASLRRALEAGP